MSLCCSGAKSRRQMLLQVPPSSCGPEFNTPLQSLPLCCTHSCNLSPNQFSSCMWAPLHVSWRTDFLLTSQSGTGITVSPGGKTCTTSSRIRGRRLQCRVSKRKRGSEVSSPRLKTCWLRHREATLKATQRSCSWFVWLLWATMFFLGRMAVNLLPGRHKRRAQSRKTTRAASCWAPTHDSNQTVRGVAHYL